MRSGRTLGSLTITLALAGALSGCLGKNGVGPGGGGVKSVSLNPPGTISITVGASQQFSATAQDAQGRTIQGVDIRLIVSVPPGSNDPPPLSMSPSGSACAGNWDPSFIFCSPGTSGVGVVTAVTNGISSQPTTVYVHQHIDSIKISNAGTQNPPHDCFSQGDPNNNTWLYQATAYSNGVDITNTIGPLSWATTNIGVLTAKTDLPNMPMNQVQITASGPGITGLYASVSGTTSNVQPVTTCLVKSVRLQAQGQSGNSVTVTNGTSVSLNATVVDTLGNVVTKPPLTWSTSDPDVVSFAASTNNTGTGNATARNNLGGAVLTASCTPPSCNIGIVPGLPIYASDGPLPNGQKAFSGIAVNVTTATKTPTYSAWAATDQCGGASGCSSAVFSITPGTTPITSILVAPRTPNSMIFNFQSSPRLYLGSDQGLMFADVGSTSAAVTPVSVSSTPCNVAVCGKVLAISSDGKRVVVSDTVSATPQAYIFDGGSNAVTDLVLTDRATAAAFSNDQSKIFIVTSSGTMYVYSTVEAMTTVAIAPSANQVAFSPTGSFGYVAGTPVANSVSAFATCDTPTTNVLNDVPISFPAAAVDPVPAFGIDSAGNTYESVVVLDPPNVDTFAVNVAQAGLQDGEFSCHPPVVTVDSLVPATSVNLGEGFFTPLYSRLVADGTALIVVGKKIPAVVVYSVTNGTTTAVPLLNNGDPLAASASSDGSQVYVAACDLYDGDGTTCLAGSTHIVNTGLSSTFPQGEVQEVPFINNGTNNMCNNLGKDAPVCVADMIAVRPQ